jgi:hypothetical protein
LFEVKWYKDEILFHLILRGHMVFVMGFMVPFAYPFQFSASGGMEIGVVE